MWTERAKHTFFWAIYLIGFCSGIYATIAYNMIGKG